MKITLVLLLVVLFASVAFSADLQSFPCGSGEKLCNGQCIPEGCICYMEGGQPAVYCRHAKENFPCGPGEKLCNGQCISTSRPCEAKENFPCGPGEKLCSGQCIPTSRPCEAKENFPCGPGEKLCNGQCIPESCICYMGGGQPAAYCRH